MRVGRGLLLVCIVLVVSLCKADEQRYEVVGLGECGDCKENNFKTSEALSGLHVTIDCKSKSGETKRIGNGELDESGKFKISLPREIIRDEKSLKEECYAQLHSAAAVPCSTRDGLEAAKIIFKSQTNNKFTFSPTKTLKFSSVLCSSKFLWPYFKYPPLPKTHSWKKNWPKITFPPFKNCPPKPFPPPIPVYKPPVVKPIPPPTPVYKPTPKPPVYKPTPKPPVYKPKPKPPVYKPKPPVYKPTPKPPVYKPKPPTKPLPPPTPVYKPKPKPPTKPLPPPSPIYKPPVMTKPLPPPFPIPPFFKKPIPPFFKKPCPPFSKIPPKYFKHPKLGYFPPLPPIFPHP